MGSDGAALSIAVMARMKAQPVPRTPSLLVRPEPEPPPKRPFVKRIVQAVVRAVETSTKP